MSSSIYQALQSCLEPRRIEPRVLRLKLTPSKSISSPPPAEEDSDLSATHSDPPIETHLEMEENDTAVIVADAEASPAASNGIGSVVGGWSILQALSGLDGRPPAKQYSPTMALSWKSLEMCTESLGSETGNDGSDEKMTLFSSETEVSPSSVSGEKSVQFSRLRAKKMAKPSYPPPLMSMSGPIGVKVKPYREGGRLVLKAVSIPSAQPCFEVERSRGSLRLRWLKRSDNLEEAEEKGESEEESSESGGRRRKGRRCKEGGGGGRKELVNWEPFLVST
ncbi:protein FANTASTIC FOUR 4-like [Cucurbita moschata]|uniref:Protein FANTASTIC FOUR 4-like n=1 Tax=Cucurbita moschata TaxID=3662 RepID=A0A6J1GPW3_CUCMO|nr:protein FANTASTIC FOUR 4-like [Cucurbita moschata]